MTSSFSPDRDRCLGQLFEWKGKLGSGSSFAARIKRCTRRAKASPTAGRIRSGGGREDKKGAWRMGLCVRVVRGLAVCWLVLGGSLVGVGIASVASSGVAAAQTANSIAVEGNRRVESETIRSYFKPGPGGRLGPGEIDEGLKALYATGLFEDVHISHPGGRLVVTVVEAPVINQVAFEGNKKAKDEPVSY